MDNERKLRAEFRQALDDVLPAAPWLGSAVAQDLRKRLDRRAPHRGDAPSRRRHLALARPGVQLAAGVLIGLIALGAVAAALALHNHALQSSPAGIDTAQYQALTARDVYRFDTAGDGTSCTTLQSTCPAPGRPVQTSLRLWLNDLNRYQPPANLLVIDAELRLYLAADISTLDAVFAAHRAQDQGALDRTSYVVDRLGIWIDGAALDVREQLQDTTDEYVSTVRLEYQAFAGCGPCQSLASAGQSDCADIQAVVCQYDVSLAMYSVDAFEFALVKDVAPSSLAAPGTALQRRLADADTGLLTMASATVSGDRAAFTAGLQSVDQSLPAIDAAALLVLGGS